MFTETIRALRPAAVLLVLLTLITGIAFPLAMTGLAQVALPGPANGSLIRDGDRIIGSELIGQNFAAPRYFHPRPSAAGKDGYDATASAGSNLAPGSKDLRDRIATSIRTDGLTSIVPPDLVTTSASGLDPHISPEAAFVQAARVASARGISKTRVETLIRERTETPLLGIIGEPRVNVLLLNRQLDKVSPNPAQ